MPGMRGRGQVKPEASTTCAHTSWSQWRFQANQPIEFVIWASQPDTIEALREYAARRLSHLVRRFELPCDVSPSASSRGARMGRDLIMVGSRGYGRVKRLVLRSVAGLSSRRRRAQLESSEHRMRSRLLSLLHTRPGASHQGADEYPASAPHSYTLEDCAVEASTNMCSVAKCIASGSAISPGMTRATSPPLGRTSSTGQTALRSTGVAADAMTIRSKRLRSGCPITMRSALSSDAVDTIVRWAIPEMAFVSM